jgi:hypothetical protein
MAEKTSTVREAVPATRREFVLTIAIAAAVWILFSSAWPLLPLRWFVTLVHEAGHAAMATMMGGHVDSVTINSHGGGLTQWRYRDRVPTMRALLVASAGYLGAAIVGAFMVELGTRLRRGRWGAVALALVIAAIEFAWVPWRTHPTGVAAIASSSSSGDGRFTTLFCVLAVIAVMALAVQPWARLRRIVILVIATALCLASVDDLRAVLDISSRGGHSDAAAAAAITPLSAWLWSAIWLILGVAACGLAAWSALTREATARATSTDTAAITSIVE